MIIINKGYMKFDDPSGSVQFTVRRCTADSSCPEVPAASLPYCGEGSASGGNFIAGCRLLDEFESVVGLDSAAFYAVTRITDTLQVRNSSCPDGVYSTSGNICSRFWTTASPSAINDSLGRLEQWAWTRQNEPRITYYVPQAENISIKLDHNVNALEFLEARPDADDLQGLSTEMDGTLHFLISDATGRVLDFIGLNERDRELPAGEVAFFTVGELLAAAGIGNEGLDTKSGPESATSMRYDGVVMIMVLTYSNDYPNFVATAKARYSVKIYRIRGAEFKYEYPVPISADVRILRNSHGVRIIFLQQGQLGRFSFQQLLVQLVSALALLKVASTIVDLIAIRAMPHRAYYKDLKWQVSQDFSDVRSEERRQSLGGQPKKIKDDDLADSARGHVEDGDEDGTDMKRMP